jgi:hypothetical protein
MFDRLGAYDRFERDRRDPRCVLPAPGIGRNIRQLEELPARAPNTMPR